MLDQMIERMTSGAKGPMELVFRVAVALIFLIGGLGHFVRSDEMLARIDGSPWLPWVTAIGDPLVLLHLSGAVFVLASLTLIAGWSTRLAAVALFVTLVPITISIHMAPGHEGPLFKNVAILGALAYLAVNGTSCCALDLLARRARAKAQP